MARRSNRKSSRQRPRLWLRALAALAVVALCWAGYLAWSVGNEFEGRRWDLPAQVYAAPLELYAGRALAAEDLVAELKRLGYREDPRLPGPGTYRLRLGRMEIATRGFNYAGDQEPERLVSLAFANGRIAALSDAGGGAAPLVRLDPLLIGSLFPAHGEDRIVLTPSEVPPLLPAALKTVEDRRFDTHLGVDL
ncbi:MAG TPA: penicillin-binding protein 1B, partial [Gammaproteobacteria bacterium]|nr:penicillin-binding protein 1B [Gammaproteobacteria bacterium]